MSFKIFTIVFYLLKRLSVSCCKNKFLFSKEEILFYSLFLSKSFYFNLSDGSNKQADKLCVGYRSTISAFIKKTL